MDSISRRGFVAGAGAVAAAAGAATMAPAALADQAEQNGASSAYPWETPDIQISDDQITETVEADVVIIGFGSSGAYCATSCVENGLTVAIVEKSDSFAAHGGSHFAFNSQAQKDLGCEVDVTYAVTDFLNLSNYKQNADLVWTWANRSGEAVDWFTEVVEPYGLHPVVQHYTDEPLTNIYPGTVIFIGGENEPVDYTDNDPYNGDLGTQYVPEIDLLSALQQELESKGAGIYFGHTSRLLSKDDSGRVTGVVAENPDGGYTRFVGSKAVVIATGSIEQEHDMVAHYCPTLTNNPAGPSVSIWGFCDGSGIKQALWAGGSMQRWGDFPTMMFWGEAHGIKNFLVNKNAVRFADENLGQSNMACALLAQPDATCYGIWNAQYAEELPAISYRADDDSFTMTPEQILAKWDATVEAGGSYIKADTLDQIAEAFGLDADTLKATVEQYNAYCEAGEDGQFHKDPATLHPIEGPFYASQFGMCCLAVMGGLHVNERSQVLAADDSPVDGLYAIGLAAGDFYANQYTTRFAGNSLGRNMTFGYLLGRQLAGLE